MNNIKIFGGSTEKCKRRECAKIKLSCSAASYKQYKKEIEILAPQFKDPICDGDTVKIDYKFTMSYYGVLVKKLQAITQLCKDESIIIDAQCDLLKRDHCIIFETLKNLERIITHLENRKQLSKENNNASASND